MKNQLALFLMLFISSLLLGQATSDITIRPIQPTGKCPNGALDLVISGGVAPYEVDWYWEVRGSSYVIERNANLPGNDGREDLEGLEPGAYRVVITDAACGQIQSTVELRQGLFSDGAERIITERVNVSECKRDSTTMQVSMDGSITLLEVLGLNPPYEVIWNGPGVQNATGNTITGLAPGAYKIVITTKDGCELSKEIIICCCGSGIKSNIEPMQCGNQEIIFPLSIEQELLFSPDDRTSFNGQIIIRVLGGTESENSIRWEGPNGFTSTATQLYNLGVGTYCVSVADGCTKVKQCFELVDCSERPLELLATTVNSCRSLSGTDLHAGVIALNPQGGWPPFEYRWNDGNRSGRRANLAAGVYCVTVSDSKGCRPESACFRIDYNPLISQAATGDRCGQAWYCNGVESPRDFRPVTTYSAYDDPLDCRVRHDYCPYDSPDRRMPNSRVVDPLTNLRWDPNSCNVLGTCPDGGTQIYTQGDFRTLWTVFLVVDQRRCPGNARCPLCFKLDICEAIVEGNREVRFLQNNWTQTGIFPTLESRPGVCDGNCIFVCDGELAVTSSGSGDLCATCPVRGKSEWNLPGIEENLSIADLILMDLEDGNDVLSTKYTFPGRITLASKFNHAEVWPTDPANFTTIEVASLEELYLHATQKASFESLLPKDLVQAINQRTAPAVEVFPNPSVGKFTVAIKGFAQSLQGDYRIQVFSTDGREVFAQDQWDGQGPQTIDLRNQASGLYLVRVNLPSGGQIVKRIIFTKKLASNA